MEDKAKKGNSTKIAATRHVKIVSQLKLIAYVLFSAFIPHGVCLGRIFVFASNSSAFELHITIGIEEKDLRILIKSHTRKKQNAF